MNFLKTFLASLLGTFVTIVLLFLITLGIVAGIVAAASSDEVTVADNSILMIDLNKKIMDRAPKLPLLDFMSNLEKAIGLTDILADIKRAKKDDRVQGILLNLSEIQAGISTVSEIREALKDFKTSGKFVYAYGETFSQKAYYLATVADTVYLNTEGGILFKGLNAELTFIKGTLEKLDIKIQVVRHGKFKAATEPFFLDKMSPENREQISLILNRQWDQILTGIAESRKIGKDNLNQLADSLSVQTAQDALTYRLVDRLVYKDELLNILRKKLGIGEMKKIPTVTIEDYTNASGSESKRKSVKEKIAVVFAQGSIGSGNGDDQTIGSERISKALRKAREDEKVKAIVFRINSGGGSALASDVIWREVVLAAREKPVVASFGDVAASGGYYIACGATRIVADPTTITGSIGVWGVIPNMQGLFNKKLGITFDETGTNKNSDFISVTKPLSPYQTAVMQQEIENIYAVFSKKVAEGRKMSQPEVDSIGQGRIWSGVDARINGLVDEFGGMNRAIELAASLAKIKDYRLEQLPEQKDALQQILDEILGGAAQSALKETLGEDYRWVEMVREVKQMKGAMTRIPVDIRIN